jgi:4a-hydroxytetrahydrobiopterin dehydratase
VRDVVPRDPQESGRRDTGEMAGTPIEDSGWVESNDGLGRDLRFADFGEAWAFMSRVALVAEKLDHHPDWSNSWSSVHITLRSHDADNTVTARDRRMAEEIDKLLG